MATTIGRYDVFADEKHKLGKGAMGIVYEGFDPETKNAVAAKKITFELEEDEEEDGGYEKEADLLRNIKPHPNIIKLYDCIRHEYTEDGIALVDLWIIMEHCALGSLKKFARTNPLSENQKLHIMYQACLALEHLHSLGVTHRDIKPENLLVTGDRKTPQLKLADFGTARIVERGSGDKSLTMHSMAGTTEYWAPEQWKFLQDGQFDYDKTVDIFSLGLTLLALLQCSPGSAMKAFTVKKSFLGQAIYQMSKQFGPEWNFVPSLASQTDYPLVVAIKQIISQMIQTQPADRMPIAQVVRRLEAVMADSHLDVKEETASYIRPASTMTSDDQPATSRPADRTHPEADDKHGTKRGGAASETNDQEARPDVRTKASIRPASTKTSDAQPASSRPADRTPPEADGKHGTKSGGAASKTSDQGVPRGVPHIVQRLTRRAATASWNAGVSERGHIVLDDRDRHISLLHGPQCDTAARMQLPREVEYNCYKAVDARGRVLVQDKADADTICLDSKGSQIYRSKSPGILFTCMGDDTLCYKERIAGTEGDWKIRLQRGGDGTPTYLEPPGRWGRYGLSVCRNNDGTYWVTDRITQSLDIFTAEGDHIRHEDLPYDPSPLHAIAATSSGHVLIAEDDPAAIHIHDASGRRVGRFTQQQMQVEEWECIHGISYCRENETLTVLAGDFLASTIRSVLTFRIGYK